MLDVPCFGHIEEENKERETCQEKFILSEKKTFDSQSLFHDYNAGQDTGRSIPSRSDESVPVARAETSTATFAFSRREKPFAKCALCQTMFNLGGNSSLIRNHYRQTSQTVGPWKVVPHQKKRTWIDSSSSNGHTWHDWRIGRHHSGERWPRARFIFDKPQTGWQKSTLQNQCQIWTTSDLDSAAPGGVFKPWVPQIAKGSCRSWILNSKEKFREPNSHKKRRISRCWQEDRQYWDLCLLEDQWCAREGCKMNDLFNIELASDNFKKFDEAWEENLMALDTEEEGADLMEGLYHPQLEKSTLMLIALALYHYDQVHGKESETYPGLKALVSDVVEDQQQNSVTSQQEKGPVKDRAIPVAPAKNNGDAKEESANSGNRNARKAKGDMRQRTPSPTERQPTPRAEVSNRTGTSRKNKSTSSFLLQER